MSVNVEDRRSIRSRRLLWEALLALLQTEDWAEITVQKICDQADVARSTFYAHYQTKQDLLDAGFALGLQEINRQISALPATPVVNQPGAVSFVPAKHWYEGSFNGAIGPRVGLAYSPDFKSGLLHTLFGGNSRSGGEEESGERDTLDHKCF